MPHVVCEVTSVGISTHEKVLDESGSRQRYNGLEIRAEIVDARVRTWGRQLYAFVGMFYIPIVVDALWFPGFNGDVQLVADAEQGASRDEDCEAASPSLTDEESQVVTTPDWTDGERTDGETPPRYAILSLATSKVREVFEERTSEVCVALLALNHSDAHKFLSRLERYGKARLALKDGSVVEILPNMVKERTGGIITAIIWSPIIILYSVAGVLYAGPHSVFFMIDVVFRLASNLVFALIPYSLLRKWVRYFDNTHLSIQKNVKEDGTEVWELRPTLKYDFDLCMELTCKPKPLIPIDRLRPGDKIKVGFGPFEHWCLFL